MPFVVRYRRPWNVPGCARVGCAALPLTAAYLAPSFPSCKENRVCWIDRHRDYQISRHENALKRDVMWISILDDQTLIRRSGQDLHQIHAVRNKEKYYC